MDRAQSTYTVLCFLSHLYGAPRRVEARQQHGKNSGEKNAGAARI